MISVVILITVCRTILMMSEFGIGLTIIIPLIEVFEWMNENFIKSQCF